MRFVLAVMAVLVLTVGMSAVPVPGPATLGGSSVVAAQQQQPVTPKAEIDIHVNRSGGGAWWRSPVWIAIGVIALVLLVVIIALIARGGGTTVIKD